MIASLFDHDALFFTIPALAGTGIFVVKLGLMALGGLGADVDADIDVDMDLGADAVPGDSTDAFALISIQSLAAFGMGFGWGGLGATYGLDWGLGASLALGLGCGLALVWLLGLMLKAIYDLQSSGNIDVRGAVGRAGTVYASVPPRGTGRGQVRVVIGERARIFEAVTDNGMIPTSTTVRVESVADDRTLLVVAG